MDWETLRKTPVLLYLAYGHGHTKLWADNVRVRPGPTFVLRLDLNRNLRVRNKRTNSYVDAQALAQGEITRLLTLQLDDQMVLDGIGRKLETLGGSPQVWHLVLDLEGTHEFVVQPEYRRQGYHESLAFHVLKREEAGLQPAAAPDGRASRKRPRASRRR